MHCECRLSGVAISLLFSLTVCGCAPTMGTMHAYPGPNRSLSEVAIIEPSAHSGDVSVIVEVDGKIVERTLPGFQKQIAVLPGKHEVEAYQGVSVGTTSIPAESQTLSFLAEAGHTYRVGGYSMTFYVSGKLVGVAAEMWIEDAQTGAVVAGERPPHL